MNNKNVLIINLFLTVFLAVISIYGYEVYLEYSTYKKNQLEYGMTLERNKLLSHGYEPQMTHLAEGQPSGELVSVGRELNFFPLGLQPLTQIVLCEEGYGWVTYRADQIGFRNSSDDWDSFSQDLLLIGDSFTHGYCVREGDDIAGHLRKYNRTVLNFGTGSYNPQHYSSVIQTFVRHLKPKNVVVVFYLGNDFRFYSPYDQNSEGKVNAGYVFDNNSHQFRLSINAKTYFQKHKEVIKKTVKIELDKFASNYEMKDWKIIDTLLLKRLRSHLFQKDGADSNVCMSSDCMADQFLAARAALDSLSENCNQTLNCKPIIVLIGGDGGVGFNPQFEPIRKEFLKYINTYNFDGAGFTYLDMVEEIGSLGMDAAPRRGGHLSVEAYRLVADAIYKNLQ